MGRQLAKELNADLLVAVLGDKIADLSQEFADWGVNKIILAENELLKNYTSDGYAKILSDIVGKYKPDLILLGATAFGRDIAPKLAAKLNVGIANDCIALKFDENKNLVGTRPMYAGKILADIVIEGMPKIFTIRQNVFPAEKMSGISSTMENFEVKLFQEDIHTKIKEVIDSLGNKIELTGGRYNCIGW